MSVVSRLAFRLPSVKALQQHAEQIAADRDRLARQQEELLGQRDTLAAERDELAAHCRRLNRELSETIERQRKALAERERLLGDRDALERERDELRGHCRRLDGEIVERIEAESRLREEMRSLDQLHREFVERATSLVSREALLDGMRRDWDERARSNAFHFTNTERFDWDEAEYAATGERNVREHIDIDMLNICQGDDPAAMRVLEIGCGAGRMTEPLGKRFGEVHAVDISAEMIRVGRQRLAGMPHVHFHQNNGMDLQELPAGYFDFALSFIVFQHIPSKDVVEAYIREVHRVLKRGRLFKFQVQGGRMPNLSPFDTWLGVSYTLQEMQQLAARNGFDLRDAHGEGTQDFWLWFFKQ